MRLLGISFWFAIRSLGSKNMDWRGNCVPCVELDEKSEERRDVGLLNLTESAGEVGLQQSFFLGRRGVEKAKSRHKNFTTQGLNRITNTYSHCALHHAWNCHIKQQPPGLSFHIAMMLLSWSRIQANPTLHAGFLLPAWLLLFGRVVESRMPPWPELPWKPAVPALA